jgi:hypothetical protein
VGLDTLDKFDAPDAAAPASSVPSVPSDDDVPLWLRPTRVGAPARPREDHAVASHPSRAEAVAAPAPAGPEPGWEADELAPRRWTPERWILLIGFGLVATALGVIANQAWLMGLPTSWVWWSSIAVVPPGLAGLAALFGWRHARHLAVVATVTTALMALFGLVEQPPVGLPQLVCALAAVGVTVAATAASRAGDPAGAVAPGDATPAEA